VDTFLTPPESGGIPGRVHFWEVPFALMLSAGWGAGDTSGRGRRSWRTGRARTPARNTPSRRRCNPVCAGGGRVSIVGGVGGGTAHRRKHGSMGNVRAFAQRNWADCNDRTVHAAPIDAKSHQAGNREVGRAAHTPGVAQQLQNGCSHWPWMMCSGRTPPSPLFRSGAQG